MMIGQMCFMILTALLTCAVNMRNEFLGKRTVSGMISNRLMLFNRVRYYMTFLIKFDQNFSSEADNMHFLTHVYLILSPIGDLFQNARRRRF